MAHGDCTGHRQDPRPQAPRLRACPSARPTGPATGPPRREGASPAQDPEHCPPVRPGPLPLVPRAGWVCGQTGPIVFPTSSPAACGQRDGALSCHRRRRRSRQSLRHPLLHAPPSPPGQAQRTAHGRAWRQRATLWSPAVQLSSAGARAQAQERPTLSRGEGGGSSYLRTLFLPLPAGGQPADSELQSKQGPGPPSLGPAQTGMSSCTLSASAQAGRCPGCDPSVGRTPPQRSRGSHGSASPSPPQSRPTPSAPSPQSPATPPADTEPSLQDAAPGRPAQGQETGRARSQVGVSPRAPAVRQETAGGSPPLAARGVAECRHCALSLCPGRPGGQRASVPNHQNEPKSEDPGS